MDAQILIDQAKLASEKHSKSDDAARLAFRVGYLEQSLKQLWNLFKDAEEIMYQQRELIERMKKGHSADL